MNGVLTTTIILQQKGWRGQGYAGNGEKAMELARMLRTDSVIVLANDGGKQHIFPRNLIQYISVG